MTVIANSLVILFISFGTIFVIVTAIGLLRLPDVYSRAHAASKSATLGVMSILIGVFLHFWLNEGIFNSRIFLGILFLFITGPVGGHMMGRAAYYSGIKVSKLTVRDDLAEVVEKKQKRAQH